MQIGPSTDPVLSQIVRRLSGAFHPESIYFFGSKARGDCGPDSDYDLFLIVPDSSYLAKMPRYRRMQHAQKVLWGIWTAVDVLILTRSEFHRESQVMCSLPATVIREGIKVYAA